MAASVAPDHEDTSSRRRRGDNPVIGFGTTVLLVIVVVVIGGLVGTSGWFDSGSSTPSSPAATPVNSEGKPAVGPIPAPPDDPCWRQTEEAVEISPSDGGQSAMPQRCIDKGF